MAKDLILSKAQNAVLAHDWTTAATLYKELLRGDESNVAYLKELGSIYVKAGEDEKAIPYYEQIITFYPHYVEAMTSLGAIFRRLKRYEESIQILQRAHEEARDAESVNYNLGFTYKEMGNYEDAIEAFTSVVASNPDDVLAHNHLGSIYLAQKQYEKSIAAYRRGLQVDPNHPILNYNLARCYEASNSYPEAVRCYNAALKTRPGWTDAIHDFSGLLIKCQQSKAAQDLVEQSIKLHPMNTDLLYILGNIYLHQFDYKNATFTLKKADSIKPEDIKILSALAQALEMGDDPETALEKVLDAMKVAPDNRELQKQYVHTLLSAKEYDKALENLSVLNDEEGQKDTEVLDLYAQYQICNNNEAAAKEYYDKIKKINHHYKNYMLEAADRFIQVGDLPKAEEYARKFIECRSKFPDGYAKLGKIYAAWGKLRNARAFYEKSLRLSGASITANSELKRLDEEIRKMEEAEKQVTAESLTEEAINENQTLLSEGEDSAASLASPEVEEALPSIYDVAEEKTDFDADVFGEDDPDLIAEEETKVSSDSDLPSAEELGLDSLSNSDENEAFDFNQMGDSLPLTDELAEAAENDFWSEFDNKEEEDEKAAEAEAPESPAASDSPVEPVLPADPLPKEEAAISPSLQEAALTSLLDSQRRALDLADRQMQMTEDYIKETVDKAVDKAIDEKIDEKMQEVFENRNIPEEESSTVESPVVEDASEDEVEDSAESFDAVDEPAESLDADEEAEEEVPENFDADEEADELEDDGFANLSFEEDEMLDADFMDVDAFDEESSDEEVPEESQLEALDEVEDVPLAEELPPAEEILETLPEAASEDKADYMLEKIHKILNNTDLKALSSDKIDLFKTLRSLLAYLPESSKNNSITRRMNMILAYLIEKLSGKPGLLATSESLIKSGVLGDEYLNQLSYSKDEEVTNSLVSKVLTDMKNLSSSLPDKDISAALCASADGILEQIELEDQKSRIF